MKISKLYRISSHRQTVEVDDVSTSANKVSNQVLIFEKELPSTQVLEKFYKNTTVGTVLIIDSFNGLDIKQFDKICGGETPFKVVKNVVHDEIMGVTCLPKDFQTFNIGQELTFEPKIFKVKVVTLSDRAFRGIYEDRSGPVAAKQVGDYFASLNKKLDLQSLIIPDSEEELLKVLDDCKQDGVDVLITTGGTGIGLRDITVNTIRPHLDKEIPGIMEMIRVKYGADKPNALLSTGVAGVMGTTLVYTLPGSVKAVNEYLSEIFKTMDHLFYMLHGIDNH